MKHFINKSQKSEIINLLSSHIDQKCDEITVAYIFGSFISNDLFSDIDIGVLVNKDLPSPLIYEMNLETMIERIVKYNTDVRILNIAPISFCQSVIRNGQLIIDKNPVLRSDFEGRILKRYFDFKRFRLRYLSEVINAPI